MYRGKGLYRHAKGGCYLVLGTAASTDDPQMLSVVYRSIDPRSMPASFWVRELGEFNSPMRGEVRFAKVTWADARGGRERLFWLLSHSLALFWKESAAISR